MNNAPFPDQPMRHVERSVPYKLFGLFGAGLVGGAVALGLAWLLDYWRQSTPVSQARVSIKPQTPIVITSRVQGLVLAETAQTLKISEISGASEVWVDLNNDVAGAVRVYSDWTIDVAKPTDKNQIKLSIRKPDGALEKELVIASSTNVASNGLVLEPSVESAAPKDGYNVSWVTLALYGEKGKFAVLDK